MAAQAAFANDCIELDWTDLDPEGQHAIPFVIQGLIQHYGPSLSRQQPLSQDIRTSWDYETVRLHGFIVPID